MEPLWLVLRLNAGLRFGVPRGGRAGSALPKRFGRVVLMRKHSQSVRFAFALLLLAAPAWGQAIVAVEEDGRRVYVNDVAAAPAPSAAQALPRYRLVYWSQTESRWKPVPGASGMRAARSAVREVQQFLGMSGVAVPRLRSNTPPPAVAPAAQAKRFSEAEVDAAIQDAATRHNVDPNLVRAMVKVESNFNPRAMSPKGAMGLMQLMPGTARELNVANPYDPQQNVEAGVRHLKGLLDSYHGDVPLTLAAYNAGPGAVERNKGIPPYRETRDYVQRITQLYGGTTARTLGPANAPIRVVRGPNGVLIISNTD